MGFGSPGPIAGNKLAPLIHEESRVAFASLQLGKVLRNHDAIALYQGHCQSGRGVGRLIVIVGSRSTLK